MPAGAGGADRARKAIAGRAELAERYARAVFAQTAGRGPARFLCPAPAGRGATVEWPAELHRQAAPAGAAGGGPAATAAEPVDGWRGGLSAARDPRRGSAVDAVVGELAEAQVAVEEVNRVKGLGAAIGGSAAAGVPFERVAAEVAREAVAFGEGGGPYLAYFPGGEAVSAERRDTVTPAAVSSEG